MNSVFGKTNSSQNQFFLLTLKQQIGRVESSVKYAKNNVHVIDRPRLTYFAEVVSGTKMNLLAFKRLLTAHLAMTEAIIAFVEMERK